MLSVPLGGFLKLSDYTLELFIYLGSYCVDSCIVGSYHGQHRLRIDRGDYRFSGFVSFILRILNVVVVERSSSLTFRWLSLFNPHSGNFVFGTLHVSISMRTGHTIKKYFRSVKRGK